MAKIDYKSLKLMRLVDKDTFSWGGQEIEVIKYLPVEARYDIVMITLQKAYEDGIYNPIKLDLFFHLNLVYIYTDIQFSDEERENESKLYDEMKSTGFLDEFLKNINPDDYREIQEDIEDISYLIMKYRTSAASVLRNFIDDLPANAEAAQKIVENFDPEKYSAVVDFAKAANGGRSITTNK